MAQACLSTSATIGVPATSPNRKVIRIASAGPEVGTLQLEFGTNAIFFGRYNSSLQPLAPVVEILRPDSPIDPIALVHDGTGYGFFFNSPNDPRLRMIRLSATGAVISGPSLVLNESFTSSRQS